MVVGGCSCCLGFGAATMFPAIPFGLTRMGVCVATADYFKQRLAFGEDLKRMILFQRLFLLQSRLVNLNGSQRR